MQTLDQKDSAVVDLRKKSKTASSRSWIACQNTTVITYSEFKSVLHIGDIKYWIKTAASLMFRKF